MASSLNPVDDTVFGVGSTMSSSLRHAYIGFDVQHVGVLVFLAEQTPVSYGLQRWLWRKLVHLGMEHYIFQRRLCFL